MKYYYFFFSLSFTLGVNAQNILLVNDNDLILDNTDSITDALDLSVYDGYDIWNIPDSSGAFPTSFFMDNYDLVIWYCSTDGGGLKLWEDGVSGNPELVTYILDGNPVWIIGADMLYQQYDAAPDAFSTGDFAYDYMGLSDYNVQSYGDDGSLGVPQLDALSGIPAYFPDSLIWAFSTAWWVDGVTGLPGTVPMYEMGPSSYTLSGEVSMLHNELNSVNVMSSFFDPALINNQSNRMAFLEAGITYLLPDDLGLNDHDNVDFSIYPNPASSFAQVTNTSDDTSVVSLTNLQGEIILTQTIAAKQNIQFDLSGMGAGIYLVRGLSTSGAIWIEKLVVY